jgi:ABC-type transporter Mla subunit MlaD
MNRLILGLAALSLTLGSCNKEQPENTKNAVTGVSNAAGSALDSAKQAADKAAEAAGNLGEQAKNTAIEQLNAFIPQIESVLASLQGKASSLTGQAAEQFQKLSNYKDELPKLIEQLKNGGADVFAQLSGKVNELVKEIPALLSSLQGQAGK